MSGTAEHHDVAIIGTGFGGLAAAHRLKSLGVDDLIILERATDVGGVWRDNDYPGAAVDVQSHLYSFSFAPNPDWMNAFSKQGEIHAYLRHVANDFDLERHIRYRHTVERMDWDDSVKRWTLDIADRSTITATHVVVATGALADPVIPRLRGIERFEGVTFHSAQWNHDFDLAGKRVAVVGTGASAIQFVPAIQPSVAALTVFQRTAPWVVHRKDHEYGPTTRRLLRTVPGLQGLLRLSIYLEREWKLIAFRNPALMKLAERGALRHLRAQVADVELRRKLTPGYRLGCKRILISNDYLRALDQPNADVVTSGIDEIRANSILDEDGVEHEVDAIIFGTGFHASEMTLTQHIYGPNRQTMSQTWAGNPTAFLGTSVAGFPNVYLMHGPNIGLGHTSVIHMFESQAAYIGAAIGYAAQHGFTAIEPTRAAQDDFAHEVDRLSEGSVWTSGGCDSWYLNDSGRNSNLWPGTTIDYRLRTRRFDPAAHLAHRSNQPVVV
jgi:cation diffusion facilitator CzcD-associated flavoprotein CzcO